MSMYNKLVGLSLDFGGGSSQAETSSASKFCLILEHFTSGFAGPFFSAPRRPGLYSYFLLLPFSSAIRLRIILPAQYPILSSLAIKTKPSGNHILYGL